MQFENFKNYKEYKTEISNGREQHQVSTISLTTQPTTVFTNLVK